MRAIVLGVRQGLGVRLGLGSGSGLGSGCDLLLGDESRIDEIVQFLPQDIVVLRPTWPGLGLGLGLGLWGWG